MARVVDDGCAFGMHILASESANLKVGLDLEEMVGKGRGVVIAGGFTGEEKDMRFFIQVHLSLF